MDCAEYDEMLRRLMGMLVGQHGINERLEATIERVAGTIAALQTANREQQNFNRQQLAINARLEVTQARMETLLSRLIPPSTNGREVSSRPGKGIRYA